MWLVACQPDDWKCQLSFICACKLCLTNRSCKTRYNVNNRQPAEHFLILPSSESIPLIAKEKEVSLTVGYRRSNSENGSWWRQSDQNDVSGAPFVYTGERLSRSAYWKRAAGKKQENKDVQDYSQGPWISGQIRNPKDLKKTAQSGYSSIKRRDSRLPALCVRSGYKQIS